MDITPGCFISFGFAQRTATLVQRIPKQVDRAVLRFINGECGGGGGDGDTGANIGFLRIVDSGGKASGLGPGDEAFKADTGGKGFCAAASAEASCAITRSKAFGADATAVPDSYLAPGASGAQPPALCGDGGAGGVARFPESYCR